MSRIRSAFSKPAKTLVTYVVAGDPDLSRSLDILKALPAAGADIIELGMPFTDPVADGPVIQAAAQRALAQGVGIAAILSLVARFRESDADTPLILMGYFNPVFAYGCARFAADAAKAGVDGLLIVDLPVEEEDELAAPCRASGLDLIRLVTPTTDAARLARLLENASGFLYYVAVAGITGTASASADRLAPALAAIREATDLPVCVGFGIRTPEDARDMAQIADGVVVGSALVEKIAGNADFAGYVSALKAAI
jgi:tryptophan synthase alpha chain